MPQNHLTFATGSEASAMVFGKYFPNPGGKPLNDAVRARMSPIPFQANGYGWATVYIIAPILGGLLGGWVYRSFFQSAYAA